jgi:glutathione peroxidase
MSPPDSEIYGMSAELLDGRTVSLSEYQGKVLLIVNTASKCGFTPQYAGLEALYGQYWERGLVVLGFPCNQFGKQEPGTAGEISEFCQRNYGIGFPMFAKIEVNGKGAHPLYRFLNQQKPAGFKWLLGDKIRWNFTKFLVGRDGKVVARYGPTTKPEKLTVEIEKLLGQFC